MEYVEIITRIRVQFGNNCTSNSRVIVRGEAEFNFDCYAYNSSQIVRKCGRLPINRTAKIKTVKVRHNKMMFMISHSKI